MTPAQARRIQLRNRWRARTVMFADLLLNRKTPLSEALTNAAAAYRDSPTGPVVLVAHHTRNIYRLITAIDHWHGDALVFSNPEAARYLRLMQRLGLFPPRTRFADRITPADIRSLANGQTALLAMADTHTTGTDQFHHIIDGRLRTFNAAWAKLAHRIHARVICLHVTTIDGRRQVAHAEIARAPSPYETAATTIDTLLSDPHAIREWDFLATGRLHPEAHPARTADDIERLMTAYAAHARHELPLA